MKYYFYLLIILLSGCQLASQSANKMKDKAIHTAHEKGFKKVELQTDTFLLTSYQKINRPSLPISIYIEGDGRSWITRSTISPNPTPLNPLALKLAIADPNANVVYLARPCQYTLHEEDEFCNPLVWTDERFSPKVIAAMNQAVDQIKKSAKVEKIHLIGFSGGGGLAVLMAAYRKQKDVASIRTIAGDLDIVAMTTYHHATPSKSSLNPKDYVKAVANIPQIHFVGEKDQVVPLSIVEGYLRELNQSTKANVMPTIKRQSQMQIIKGHTHQEGWGESWTRLMRVPL